MEISGLFSPDTLELLAKRFVLNKTKVNYGYYKFLCRFSVVVLFQAIDFSTLIMR